MGVKVTSAVHIISDQDTLDVCHDGESVELKSAYTDSSLYFTVEEAREVAAALMLIADEIEEQEQS